MCMCPSTANFEKEPANSGILMLPLPPTPTPPPPHPTPHTCYAPGSLTPMLVSGHRVLQLVSEAAVCCLTSTSNGVY